MGWLENYVTLITGAGSGLGRAVLERLLEEGSKVAILEIAPERCLELERTYSDANVVAVQGDATLYRDNARAVEAVLGAFGRLDTFIGNAGMYDYGQTIGTLRPDRASDAFDELFGLNVKAYLLGAMATADPLRRSHGSMIFTLSNAAFDPGSSGPLYTASKHAVVGLVRQLAYDLAPDIRVNGVAPGGVRSDLRGPRSLGLDAVSWAQTVNLDEVLPAMTPLGVGADPAQYTGNYVLLASRENSAATTAEIIRCDGGVAIRGRRQAEEFRSRLGMGR